MLKLQNIYAYTLKGLFLSLLEGEFVSIIGANGAGKSTLFSVISGGLKPEKGTVFIDGNDVTSLSQEKRAHLIAYVMQDPSFGTIGSMTIFENMALQAERGVRKSFFPIKSKGRKDSFSEKLKLLNMNLENRLEEKVSSLSGGERQALSLVMATLSPAKILLLDEITAALDPKAKEKVLEIAITLARESGLTTLMITHSMDELSKVSGRVLRLEEGVLKEHYGKN